MNKFIILLTFIAICVAQKCYPASVSGYNVYKCDIGCSYFEADVAFLGSGSFTITGLGAQQFSRMATGQPFMASAYVQTRDTFNFYNWVFSEASSTYYYVITNNSSAVQVTVGSMRCVNCG